MQGMVCIFPHFLHRAAGDEDRFPQRAALVPAGPKKAPAGEPVGAKERMYEADQESIPREVRYFLTIRATLNVMASSNSRRSSPVSFLIFSRR